MSTVLDANPGLLDLVYQDMIKTSAFRTFSRLDMGQYPSKSILQKNIKAIKEETWETILCEIMGYAVREKMETGKVKLGRIQTLCLKQSCLVQTAGYGTDQTCRSLRMGMATGFIIMKSTAL